MDTPAPPSGPASTTGPRLVGFTEAVRNGFTGYAQFSGRSTRAEFWFFQLAVFAVLVVAMGMDVAAGLNGILYIVVALALVVPTIAVTVRRLHDQDKSGWWYFISFVPFVGGIWLLVLMCLESSPGANQYGPLTT
jgi:uncharacterized membrane protein YhaH (DUF805 family)